MVVISAGVLLGTSLNELSWNLISKPSFRIPSHANVDSTRCSIDKSRHSIKIWEGTGRNYQFPPGQQGQQGRQNEKKNKKKQ
jgi:hypothetical protein